MLIKAKDNGLDLYSHSEAVKDTAFIMNNKGNFKLNNKIIYWMCILHDIGKANPLFQNNMFTKDYTNICRHEISSILFIDIVPKTIRDIVALSILSHHKSLINDERSIYELYDKQEDKLYNNHIGNIEEWGQIVKNYLQYHYNIKIKIPSKERCKEIIDYYCEKIEKLEKGYSLYRGLLMQADHFASCYDNDKERLKNLDKLYNIPSVEFYNIQNENYPLSLISSQKNKKHTFCVAPTGCGKTNLVLKRTSKRIFYTLPYQASINAMYKRINNDIGNEFLIGLKHSSLSSLSFIDEQIKDLSSFYGLPVKVITPFQILSISLRLKGYESIILDLKGQDVIFDELHTYDIMSQSYILEMIKLLINLGCSIHICTATMPSCIQEKILDILGRKNTQIIKLDNKTLNTFNRHIIHTSEFINYDEIKKRYEKGEKILIVNNQVKLAQETYSDINNIIPNCKSLILHSRFKRQDRNRKEELLLQEFNNKNEGCIVVSTQVVEVSIDINFDVIFTDCADIMSLIQRFGRVNRQRKNIGLLKDVYIIKNREKNYLPYDKEICDRTFNILNEYNNKILKETEIQKIIDFVHSTLSENRYENACPYDNNQWRSKMFTNIVGSSISSEFEFEGYVGILENDKEEYIKNNNKSLEIPISRKNNDFIEYANNNKHFYIIPNMRYNEEIGLF